MGNLLVEIGRWLFLSAVPTQRVRDFFRIAAHSTYVLLPILAVLCMLFGLHTGWVGGYVLAAILSIIPVVLFDLVRRLAKEIPEAGEVANRWVSTAATPHTWLAILNFFFIILQPSAEYRPQAYLAILAITLFIVVSGRWGHEPKWYRPLTRFVLFICALLAVVNLTMDAFWPEELVALKTSLGINRGQGPKDLHSQRYDQDIQRAVESGVPYRLVEHIFGDDEFIPLPEPVTVNDLLWRVKIRHRRGPDGLYYSKFMRQYGTLVQPDLNQMVWYPESKVAAGGPLETRLVKMPVGTVCYADSLGVPTLLDEHTNAEIEVELTKTSAYVNGRQVFFGRFFSAGRRFEYWFET